MTGPCTRAGKSSSQLIAIVRQHHDPILPEPSLTPLVPSGPSLNVTAYCRFLDYLTQTAPELLARARR